LSSCADSSVPAQERVAFCSKALQSHMLGPDEVALARVSRGTARVELGEKVMATVDYQEALRHYDNIIDPRSSNALALYRRGVAHDGTGQTDKALNDYDAAIRLAPDDARAYFERAVLLAGRKRAYDRAIADFSRAVELDPRDVRTLLRRGDAYGQMAQFALALADFDRAIALAPNFAPSYVARGVVNARRKAYDLALPDFATALRLQPRNAAALKNRAAVLADQRNWDAALSDLDAAVAISPADPIALYNRGYVYLSTDRYPLAIRDFSAAINLEPDMGVAYNNRCLARTLEGKDLVAAIADCDNALKFNPTNIDGRITRGFIYLKLGDPAIAVREFSAALDVDPNRALALYGRGAARIRMGHRKEGETDIAAARAIDPGVEAQYARHGVN
jgi:tetratricopeptide (TPR) repeat protein